MHVDPKIDPQNYCNPIKDFNSPETLGESIIALAAMYVGCYIISLLIMKLLSKKYEWDRNPLELSKQS
jgi:hypothetical protein